jgi:ribonucleoside-diphosphate reductase beta chain
MMPERDRSGGDGSLAATLNDFVVVLPNLPADRMKNQPRQPGTAVIGAEFSDQIVQYPGIIANIEMLEKRARGVGIVATLPEVETWITPWTFSETIHSRSYTHIIRNVYSDPAKVFDEMLDIQEIADCAGDISKYYDNLIDMNTEAAALGNFSHYKHKKALWLCLNAVNALEGVRFYVSFACSWNFAELKKMEGNAKIIKLIARDENIHLASTQQLIKILPKEDPDFAKISDETRDECIRMFYDVVAQEKAWAKYLFKDGSMIGLNEQLLCDYVDHIAAKRMGAIGLNGKPGPNPLPWTQKWISGADVQVAPQETEITSYINGGVKKDVDQDTFKGFNL